MKTLTLNGLNLECDTDSPAIKLPDDSIIAIAEGSENLIANSEGAGIICLGDLAIDGLLGLTFQSDEGKGIRTGKGENQDVLWAMFFSILLILY